MVVDSEFHVAIQAKTTRGSAFYRQTDTSSERLLLNTFVVFCGFAQGGEFMHQDTMDNMEICAFAFF